MRQALLWLESYESLDNATFCVVWESYQGHGLGVGGSVVSILPYIETIGLSEEGSEHMSMEQCTHVPIFSSIGVMHRSEVWHMCGQGVTARSDEGVR